MSDTTTVGSKTSSYLDTQQLGKLRGQAAQDPAKAARATAEQFEAYFIQQMITAMRKTVEKSDLVQSDAADTYQDMFDKELATAMAKRGGIGLADVLEKQLSPNTQTSTADALSQHPGNAAAKGFKLKPDVTPLALPSGQPTPLALPPKQGALPLPPKPGTQAIPLTDKQKNAITDPAVPVSSTSAVPAATNAAWTPSDADIDGWIRWQQKQIDPVLVQNIGEQYAAQNPGKDPLADPALRAMAAEQLQRERGNNIVIALNGGFPKEGFIASSSDEKTGAIMMGRPDGHTDVYFPDGTHEIAAAGKNPAEVLAAYSGPTVGNYGVLDSLLLKIVWQESQTQQA